MNTKLQSPPDGRDRVELLRRIVRQKPDPQATLELAELLLASGNVAECEQHARSALVLTPRHPQAHRIMGMVFMQTGRPVAAEVHFRRIVELAGERARVAASLADCLMLQGKLDDSEEWFRKAAALDPANADLRIRWCRLAEARRDFPRAWELLRDAERIAGDTASIRATRAVLLGREGKPDMAAEELTRDLESGAAPSVRSLLERGRHYQDMKQFDRAWADFAEGKRLCREAEGLRYDGQFAIRYAERLKQFFTRDRMSLIPPAGLREGVPQPLFILGFPRSGTTMVEQTLAAHPQVCAGDELEFLTLVINTFPRWLGSQFAYPECLAELPIGDNRFLADQLRDYYLGLAQQSGLLGDGIRYFTDKMPLNETHLGLIRLLFPHSPLIYVRRHPLDIVCSNFEKHLRHGFNQAFALETIARHYLLIDDLLAHYREQLDLNLLEVRYEDLISSQDTEVRRMLQFAGLDFDARCLSFHENARVSRTVSYAQVSEKLYDRSVYRFRHYRKHLDEVVGILQPTLARLGYSPD